MKYILRTQTKSFNQLAKRSFTIKNIKVFSNIGIDQAHEQFDKVSKLMGSNRIAGRQFTVN